jgi:hypothetical protein
MREVVICTAAQRFSLNNDQSMDLLAHVRRDANDYQVAAEEPLLNAINAGGVAEVKWSDQGKRGALRAIEAWLRSEGTPDIPEPVMQLRYELMRDLLVPPFDS